MSDTLCDFSLSLTCPKCGWTAKHAKTFRRCRPPKSVKPKEWQPWAIGDIVEKGLTAIGITKELVEKVTRTEGKPGGCGCGRRKKWLNEAGFKAQHAARKALIKAKRFYLGDGD